MDLTIAASELAKGTDKSQGASINIKNNTQTEGSTKAADFARIFIFKSRTLARGRQKGRRL